jgi:hypothetical protein
MARKASPPDHEAERGAAPAAGAPYNPTDRPDEDPSPGTPPSRSVSHSQPIDPSEYRKLKEQAAGGGRPRSGEAQEDDAASSCDEDG